MENIQDYRIDFPSFGCDNVEVMTEEDWEKADLSPSHNYEHVTIGDGGDYQSVDELLDWVRQENDRRR